MYARRKRPLQRCIEKKKNSKFLDFVSCKLCTTMNCFCRSHSIYQCIHSKVNKWQRKKDVFFSMVRKHYIACGLWIGKSDFYLYVCCGKFLSFVLNAVAANNSICFVNANYHVEFCWWRNQWSIKCRVEAHIIHDIHSTTGRRIHTDTHGHILFLCNFDIFGLLILFSSNFTIFNVKHSRNIYWQANKYTSKWWKKSKRLYAKHLLGNHSCQQ